MTDTPKLKATDLLPLTWEQLERLIRGLYLGVMGQTGPWKHVWETETHAWTDQRITSCACCNREYKDVETDYDCPVPPPITDPPEVVAERLLRSLDDNQWVLFVGHVWALRIKQSKQAGTWYKWCFHKNGPEMRIIICLIALGLVEGI